MNDGALRSQAERLAKIQRKKEIEWQDKGKVIVIQLLPYLNICSVVKEVLVLPIDVDEGIRDKYLVFLLFFFPKIILHLFTPK